MKRIVPPGLEIILQPVRNPFEAGQLGEATVGQVVRQRLVAEKESREERCLLAR